MGENIHSKCKTDPEFSNYEKFNGVSDPTLATNLQEQLLAKFWCSIEEFPPSSKKAIKIFCPVPATYVCEAKLFIHIT